MNSTHTQATNAHSHTRIQNAQRRGVFLRPRHRRSQSQSSRRHSLAAATTTEAAEQRAAAAAEAKAEAAVSQ